MDVLTPEGETRWSAPGSEPAPTTPRSLLRSPLKDGDVAFSETSVEDGRTLATCLARAGALVIALRTDVTHGLLPSLGSGSPPAPGGYDVYLARRTRDGVEVADHNPARLGRTHIYPLPADSAVSLALERGTMASGRDHFGRTVFAMPARAVWQGWTPVAAREVGRAQSDSRWLAADIARLRPGTKVLYASGYSDDALSHEGVLDPGLRLLPKPFSRESLLAAVRETLDEAPSAPGA